MSKKNGTFDRKPWYEEINDVIEQRHRKCGLNGDGYVYDVPDNAFAIKNVHDFEKNHPFNFKKNCVRPQRVGLPKDEYLRFFTGVHDPVSCKVARGVWDPKTPHRANRFGRGTCWLKDDDAECGAVGVHQVLRRENPPNKAILLKDAETKCNAMDKCTWAKLKGQPVDCVRKSAVEIAGAAVEVPPDDMPADVTNGKIEQYLYDWYIHKKHGTPPNTKELFGEGDRCNPPKSKHDAATSKKKEPDFKNINWNKIDASKPADQKILRNIMSFMHLPGSENVLRKIINRANLLKANPSSNFDDDPIDDLRREFQAFLDEQKADEDDDKTNAFLPSIPQSVVNMIMKNIVIKNSSNRGLMALHSTGSGKTCTAAGVMDAFWDSKRQIIFASSIDAVASNPPFKFHECAARLYPRFKKDPFAGKTFDDTLNLISLAFDTRGIIFLPFAKLANRIAKTEKFKSILKLGSGNAKKLAVGGDAQKILQTSDSKPKVTNIGKLVDHVHSVYPHVDKNKIYDALKLANIASRDDYIDLDNAVLIIDEVHNLFRPLPMQREKHRFVEKHIVDPNVHPNLKVVILTATPGDNIPDIIKLLNIVRDHTHPPIIPPNVDNADDLDKFKNSIRGLVSFFDMSFDTTQFPVVHDKGPIKYPMSNKQFEKYVEAYKDVKANFKDYDKLALNNQLNKFWQGPRKYANMLFNFEKGLALSEFSSKLPALLDNINAYPSHKHYVYSSFYEARGSGQGILEIARQLEQSGYQKLTVKDAKEWNKKGLLPPKRKRYVLALQKDIGDEGSSSAGLNLAELIKIFNHPDNKHGDIVHVFLATQGFNEGIDLKAVRHIHFFEPLVTMASDLQTIGRARRFCSHADLDRDKGEWSVFIHRYLADFPINTSFIDIDSINKHIHDHKEFIQKHKPLIESMKGWKKDKIALTYGDPDYRENIKALISDKSKLIKDLEKNAKLAAKNDLKNIINIDDFVFHQAIQKMKELFIIHSAIKQAAVDCRLLHNFHNSNSSSISNCL